MKSTEQLCVTLAMMALWSVGAQAAELTPQQIYGEASPAVVMVLGYSGGSAKGSGGTGSIIRRDGLVLTNAHVVVEEKTGKPYPKLFAYVKPERVTGNHQKDLSRGYKASVVAFSQPLDLALLKLEGAPALLPVLELGASDRVRIGDRVVAIGHPEQGGLWTLTTGVISAEFEDFQNTKGKHVFQTETGLNRGNSGGPLLDTHGRIVGVNTAIARLAPDGMPITSISFSLKSGVALAWLRQQGVTAEYASGPTDSSAAGPKPSTPAGSSGPTAGTSPSSQTPAPQVQTPDRPYNLDQLISERSKAEAEMENMMREMRQSIREKAGRR